MHSVTPIVQVALGTKLPLPGVGCMSERIEIDLETLANLLYLAGVEADDPIKIRKHMALAEDVLARLSLRVLELRPKSPRSKN